MFHCSVYMQHTFDSQRRILRVLPIKATRAVSIAHCPRLPPYVKRAFIFARNTSIHARFRAYKHTHDTYADKFTITLVIRLTHDQTHTHLRLSSSLQRTWSTLGIGCARSSGARSRSEYAEGTHLSGSRAVSTLFLGDDGLPHQHGYFHTGGSCDCRARVQRRGATRLVLSLVTLPWAHCDSTLHHLAHVAAPHTTRVRSCICLSLSPLLTRSRDRPRTEPSAQTNEWTRQ
jgi:hypothetical protein